MVSAIGFVPPEPEGVGKTAKWTGGLGEYQRGQCHPMGGIELGEVGYRLMQLRCARLITVPGGRSGSADQSAAGTELGKLRAGPGGINSQLARHIVGRKLRARSRMEQQQNLQLHHRIDLAGHECFDAFRNVLVCHACYPAACLTISRPETAQSSGASGSWEAIKITMPRYWPTGRH